MVSGDTPANPAGTGASHPLPEVAGFELRRRLGRGFSGAVYLARREGRAEHLALKVFAPDRLEGSLLERFRREAHILSEHPHECLVTLLDADLSARPPWMAFEYLAGGDLEAYRRPGSLLPPGAVRAHGLRVAEALDHLHAQGVLHRDVKPGNILLDGACRARLGDLGLGALEDQGALTLSGQRLGTWTYMAPEVQLGQPAKPASDRYSLAAVIVELLVGRVPRRTARGIHVPEELDDLDLGARLPGRLRQCLRTDPGDRPGDLAGLREALAS